MIATVLAPRSLPRVASWGAALLGSSMFGIASDPLATSLSCGLLGVTLLGIGNRVSREQDRRTRRDRLGRRLDRYVLSSALRD